MPNQNHDGHNNSSMIWIMLIGCFLPVILLSFNVNLPSWVIIALIAVCPLLHFLHMRQGAKHKAKISNPSIEEQV